MTKVPPTDAGGTFGTAGPYWKHGSEVDLQSELDGPRLIHLGPEPAERRRHAEIGAGSSEDYAVEGIDEVCSEVDSYALVDRCSLDDRKVLIQPRGCTKVRKI